MKWAVGAAVALISTAAEAARATEHEQIKFDSFHQVVSKYEFDWEVHQV